MNEAPLEFVIKHYYDNKNKEHHVLVFFYEDKSSISIELKKMIKGIELGRHYSIKDLYGYKVEPDFEDKVENN